MSTQPYHPTTEWTIMLYMAADDTLANFAVESLRRVNESTKSRGEQNVTVVAELALPVSGAMQSAKSRPVASNQNRHRFVFPDGHGRSLRENETAITALSVQNSNRSAKPSAPSSPETAALLEFLNFAYEKYPAEKYALILWGHGPELLLQSPSEGHGGSHTNLFLTPQELREVLAECKKLRSDAHLEVIGFDACCMSMLEMACELKGQANYMVASQEDVLI